MTPTRFDEDGHTPETQNTKNTMSGLFNTNLNQKGYVAASMEDDNQEGKRKSTSCPGIQWSLPWEKRRTEWAS